MDGFGDPFGKSRFCSVGGMALHMARGGADEVQGGLD